MVIIDILIYVFFAWVMSNLARKSYISYPYSSKIDKNLVWFIVFYTVVSAIRWKVGVDSMGYARDFIVGTMGADAEGAKYKEIISQAIVHTFYNLGIHFSIGIGLYSFLQIFFITKILAKYKYILVYVPIVLFGSRYYFTEMNGMRQMIVASAFVFFSKFIYERKAIKYFLSILLSMMVHQSALMLLPLYFLPQKVTEIANRRKLMIVFFVTCFIIGQTPQFHLLSQYGESIGLLLGYQDYGLMLSEKAVGDFSNETKSIGPVTLSYIVIVIANIWFGKRLKARYEKKIPYFNLWFFFSFVWGCTYFLFRNAGTLFSRPWLYFCLFEMIIFSLVIYDLILTGRSLQKYKIIAISLIISAWMSTTYGIIKVANNPEEDFATYKVFFMHQDEVTAIKKM